MTKLIYMKSSALFFFRREQVRDKFLEKNEKFSNQLLGLVFTDICGQWESNR